MKKTFMVETDHDTDSDLVTIAIKCTPPMVPVAMDVVRMQTEAQIEPMPQLQEGAIAPPLTPRQPAPVVPIRSQVDTWVDAEWKERSSGPVLPNTRGF